MYGEAHCMDAHTAVTTSSFSVQAIHGLHDFLNRCAGELITKYVDGDFFARIVEGSYRIGNALDRRRVREDIPVPQVLQNETSPGWGVGNPLAAIATEQIVAHIVEYLNAFYFRIDIQCCLHLLQHAVPCVGEH